MIQLTTGPIDHCSLTERARRPGCGAVVAFLGTVRDLTDGRVTCDLDYEAYPRMAEAALTAVENEVRARWPVGDVILVHRLGKLVVEDVSVLVIVSCPHRAQAFEACRFAIDRIKETVPIWKKENRDDGTSEWIHPGMSDEKAAKEPRIEKSWPVR
jgi:molybdopterin synthase catalytic subunit